MNTVLELLSQRRIWAGIVGIVAFVVTALNLGLDIDVPVLTGLLTDVGMAMAALMSAVLALLSYFRPKK